MLYITLYIYMYIYIYIIYIFIDNLFTEFRINSTRYNTVDLNIIFG